MLPVNIARKRFLCHIVQLISVNITITKLGNEWYQSLLLNRIGFLSCNLQTVAPRDVLIEYRLKILIEYRHKNIFALWFLSFFLLSFFPRLISAVGDWMSTTWCGLSVNLECRSEMCSLNYSTQKSPKVAICAPSYNVVRLYLRSKTCIDNRKKLVKQQYLLHMSS